MLFFRFFFEKYFIKNSYPVAVSRALVSKIEFYSKFRSYLTSRELRSSSGSLFSKRFSRRCSCFILMTLWKWPIFRPSARPTNSYSLRSYRIGILSVEFESNKYNEIRRDGFSNLRGAEKRPDYCLGAAKRGKQNVGDWGWKCGNMTYEIWKSVLDRATRGSNPVRFSS